MEVLFKPWPALKAHAKLFPSKRFPGLFYYEYDPPGGSHADKPVLILIHGLGDEADTWRHLIPLLGSAGYRILAPDLPGFGRSPIPRRSGLRPQRDAVLELAETVSGNTGGVVLVGSSMGAAVAEAAALASWKNPVQLNLIKALILLDGCIPVKSSFSPQLIAAALPVIGKKWYRSFRNNPRKAWHSLFPYYADIYGLPEADREFLQARVMDRVWSISQERGFFSSMQSMIVQGLRASYYRQISTWPKKIFLVWGEKDVIFSRSHAESLIKLRGGNPTELSVISGAGHLPHQEMPAGTAEVILTFLRTL